MKKLLLSTILLLVLSAFITSCNKEKRTDDVKDETASLGQVVLDYHEWNLENRCPIIHNVNRDDGKHLITLNNVREWLIKLELTGFFSDSYIENKKIYYEDLEYHFNNSTDDPDAVMHTTLEDRFDNINILYDSSNERLRLNKILIKNVTINDERASMDIYTYFITSNLNGKNKELQIVTEKDNFEIDDKFKSGKNNFVITLIKENGKWLIDSATKIRK